MISQAESTTPEPISSQISKQFQHRLVDHLGIRVMCYWMFGRCNPVASDFVEFIRSHACVSGKCKLDDRLLAACQRRLQITI